MDVTNKYYPPRENKKGLSNSFFKINLKFKQFKQWFTHTSKPKSSPTAPIVPEVAVILSYLIPGAGHFYITKNILLFIAIFIPYLLLFLTAWLSQGLLLGTIISMLTISLHSFLVFDTYTRARTKCSLPAIKPGQMVKLSLLLTVVIPLFYFLATQQLNTIATPMIVNWNLEPTFSQGNRVLVIPQKSYSYGDIVMFGPNRQMFERIIALPGDEVSVVDNKLYVNNNLASDNLVPLNKDVLKEQKLQGVKKVVPEKCYCVLYIIQSDYNFNIDVVIQNYFLPINNIYGKIVMKYYPRLQRL